MRRLLIGAACVALFSLAAAAQAPPASPLDQSIQRATKLAENARAALMKTPEWANYEEARRLLEELQALRQKGKDAK